MFGRKKPPATMPAAGPKPATMPQLQAGANAIRGLPQGLKQIPVNIPKPGTPLAGDQRAGQEKLANAAAAAARANPAMAAKMNSPKVGVALASKMGGMGGAQGMGMKKGGAVKASSASKRADGCATKGKTKGKMV
jgi:hypothetical protein